MQPINQELEIFNRYLHLFKIEREQFFALHRQMVTNHPEWIRNNDARTNLLAKPVNFLLTALANFHLYRYAMHDIRFWEMTIGLNPVPPHEAEAAGFELMTFYRVATFTFLFSSIEHGCRAILRTIDPTAHSEGAFKTVSDHLFTRAATVTNASKHIQLLDFMRIMRNTIHNNGVFLPVNGRDIEFVIDSHTYNFISGKRAEFFGWDTTLQILPPIRLLLVDLINAPEVLSCPMIEDIASHS